jgi:hypothetical protein
MSRLILSVLLWAGMGACAAAQSVGPAAPTSPFRYDDDPTVFARAPADDLYARLKFIPLAENSYLSFGADLRERVESSDVGLLGFRDKTSDIYDLHRLLVYADLQLGPDLRVFGQVGNHDETGRAPGPAPTDVDRFDVQQAFVDLSHAVAGGRATLRVGRAEMSYDDGAIIGLRDGPNVRQVWDGVRGIYVTGPWRWDVFAVKPVQVNPGVLDDGPQPGQSLEGVHLTTAPALISPLTLDAFYYRNINPNVSLLPTSGREASNTFGARLRGAEGRLDASGGLIGQTGELGNRPVRAFSAHVDAGWSFPAPGTPHLLLRADVLSGGDPRKNTVETFNGLYPNVAYSTEATIEAPANLIQAGLVARVDPLPTLRLQYTLEGLWRYSTKDAFYAAPLIPLVRPDGTNDRYSGMEQQVSMAWRLNPIVTLNAAYVHFGVGEFIRRGGGHDENFGMTSISFRL